MKERRTPNYISLDQANVAVAMFDRQRTFINCLPSIDLEMRFQGTFFWEMDDLDRTPAEQTLVPSFVLEIWVVRASLYVS